MTDTGLGATATPLAKTAIFGAEVFVPGAARFADGDVGSGVAHFLAAGVVTTLIAPSMPLIGALAVIGVRANSLFKTMSGRDLWESAPAQSVATDVSNLGKNVTTPPKSGS